MKQQIKKLQTLLAQLETQHEKAARFASEEVAVSDEAHATFILEENTLIEITRTTLALYLNYYDNTLHLTRLGYLLKQI